MNQLRCWLSTEVMTLWRDRNVCIIIMATNCDHSQSNSFTVSLELLQPCKQATNSSASNVGSHY